MERKWKESEIPAEAMWARDVALIRKIKNQVVKSRLKSRTGFETEKLFPKKYAAAQASDVLAKYNEGCSAQPIERFFPSKCMTGDKNRLKTWTVGWFIKT